VVQFNSTLGVRSVLHRSLIISLLDGLLTVAHLTNFFSQESQ
jgi:hypothetical protein